MWGKGWVGRWMDLMGGVLIMVLYIMHPSWNTLYLSLRNKDDTGWATQSCAPNQPCWGIFENYRYALTSSDMQRALFNNIIWITTLVTLTVLFGLLIATLASRVRYESVAKSIIFMPLAI